MSSFSIKGKVVYQNIGTGFWGIIDESGNQWEPVNMPNQIKYEGKEVQVVAKETHEDSMNMWGKTVKIISFSTMTP